MEEFVLISGDIIELHIAVEITGLTAAELRSAGKVIKLDTTPSDYPRNGFEDFEDEIYNHGNY